MGVAEGESSICADIIEEYSLEEKNTNKFSASTTIFVKNRVKIRFIANLCCTP